MSFKQAVRANHKAVLSLTEQELEEVLPVLREIRESFASKIYDLLKAGDSYAVHRQRALLLQLQNVIKLAERELPQAMHSELADGVKPITKKAVSRLQAMVTAGDLQYRGSVTQLKLPFTKILLGTGKTLMERYPGSAIRYAGEVGQRIRRDMAIGMLRGESIDETARRMLGTSYERTAKKGKAAVAESIANRQYLQNMAQARRLVRTERVHAYNTVQADALVEANNDDPGWFKRWDASLDKRTCKVCRGMHNEIVPAHAMFSCGVYAPPIHPNDRCSCVPWRKGWPK